MGREIEHPQRGEDAQTESQEVFLTLEEALAGIETRDSRLYPWDRVIAALESYRNTRGEDLDAQRPALKELHSVLSEAARADEGHGPVASALACVERLQELSRE